MKLGIEARGLTGAGADEAVGPGQLDLLEVAVGEIHCRQAAVLGGGAAEDRVVVRGRAVDDAVVDVTS